jgi:hypothetical protein
MGAEERLKAELQRADRNIKDRKMVRQKEE